MGRRRHTSWYHPWWWFIQDAIFFAMHAIGWFHLLGACINRFWHVMHLRGLNQRIQDLDSGEAVQLERQNIIHSFVMLSQRAGKSSNRVFGHNVIGPHPRISTPTLLDGNSRTSTDKQIESFFRGAKKWCWWNISRQLSRCFIFYTWRSYFTYQIRSTLPKCSTRRQKNCIPWSQISQSMLSLTCYPSFTCI